MATGDNMITARSVSKDIGLIGQDPDEAEEMEGPTFYDKFEPLLADGNVKVLKYELDQIKFVARCRPEDKFLLVQCLMKCGEVVAVTGDGINDAPVLKLAHVGMACGMEGSDVAKAASDVILLRDHLEEAIQGIMTLKWEMDNIRSMFVLMAPTTITMLVMISLGCLVYSESPFTPVQLLCYYLSTYVMFALTFMIQTRGRRDSTSPHIITKTVSKHIILMSLF